MLRTPSRAALVCGLPGLSTLCVPRVFATPAHRHHAKFQYARHRPQLHTFNNYRMYSGGAPQLTRQEMCALLQCSEEDIDKMLGRNASLLRRSAASVQEQLDELSAMLYCDAQKTASLVRTEPNLLGYNTDSMRTKLDELSAMLYCDAQKTASLVRSQPSLLGLNTDSMRNKLDVLRKVLSIDLISCQGLVRKQPAVLNSNADGYAERIDNLVSLGFTREQAIAMALACPSLLYYHPTRNVAPTVRFLVSNGIASLEYLSSSPSLISFSLSKRIEPLFKVYGKKLTPALIRSTKPST